MRLLWSMIAAVFVAAITVALFERSVEEGPAEIPAMLPEWLPAVGEAESAVREQTPVPQSESASIYRWRDANGVLHIESAPPPEGAVYEEIRYQLRHREPDPPAASPAPPTVSERAGPPTPQSPLSVYTPEGLSELLDRADRTSRQLEQRQELLEELHREL